MLDTGIRINEVCNIRIQHLDRNRLTLTIPAEVAKNRKSRTLPVSRKVMKMMVELHEENKEYFNEQEHVFLTAYGEAMIPDTFRRRLWKYAEEAGVASDSAHVPAYIRAGLLAKWRGLVHVADNFRPRGYIDNEAVYPNG